MYLLRGDHLLSQVDLILLVQQIHNTVTDYLFMGITMLGAEGFYLFMVPAIYWCFSREVGYRVGILFLGSMFLNYWLKDWFQVPRPDPKVVKVLFASSASGYSFPSGHAQGAATFWGYLAVRSENRKLIYWAAALILLVSFSRIYLGVHYPVDVLAAMGLGLALVFGFRLLEKRFIPLLEGVSHYGLLVTAVVLPLVFLLLYHEPVAYKLAGAMIGLAAGHLLGSRLIEFRVSTSIPRQVIKVAAGIVILVLLRTGAKVLLPVSDFSNLFSYFLVTVGATLLVPYIFVKSGLAQE